MSDLKSILEDLVVREFEEVVLVSQEDLDQAKSQIKAWVEENVIGKDEPTSYGKVTHDNLIEAQNELRQSQRQQLREEK